MAINFQDLRCQRETSEYTVVLKRLRTYIQMLGIVNVSRFTVVFNQLSYIYFNLRKRVSIKRKYTVT